MYIYKHTTRCEEEKKEIFFQIRKKLKPRNLLKIRSPERRRFASGVMAAFRVFLLTVFLSVILAHVGAEADASVSDVVEEVKLAGSDGPDSAVLEQLKSKIHSLG